MNMTTPVVLDEDTYAEALSTIVERDFYPQLATWKSRTNHLEGQPISVIAGFERTPKAVHSHNASSSNCDLAVNYYNPEATELADRVNLNLSLDQFQTVYTSEDNASFTDVLEKTNARRKEKYRWLLDKEAQIEASKRLLECHADRPDVDDDGFVRPPDMWRYKAKNALMYIPDGTGKSLLNEKDSRAPQKCITHSNTNFNSDDQAQGSSSMLIQPEMTTPRRRIVDDDNQSIASETTIGYRGYHLVDATPSPNPSRVGTPIMTWGSIEGSPTLLHNSEASGPQFSLPKVCKREELGMRLSEKASRARRKHRAEKLVKGTPGTGSGLMSPAARHLLRRSGTPKSSGFGEALRSSYSQAGTPGSKTPFTPLFKAGATPNTAAFKSPFYKK